jgi:hypothetical protein
MGGAERNAPPMVRTRSDVFQNEQDGLPTASPGIGSGYSPSVILGKPRDGRNAAKIQISSGWPARRARQERARQLALQNFCACRVASNGNRHCRQIAGCSPTSLPFPDSRLRQRSQVTHSITSPRHLVSRR